MTWRSAPPPVRSRLLGEDGVATLDDQGLTLEFAAGRWRFKTAVALRRYPLDTVAGLAYEPPGNGHNGSISVAVRPGRDPLREFLTDRRLSARTDPDCLVVTPDQFTAAGHFVARARAAVERAAATGAPVSTGRLPVELRGADGTAAFDGRDLVLAFGGRAADPVKRELGTRVIPVAAIHAVQLEHPDRSGWIRFVPAGGPPLPRLPPARDPDTLCLTADSYRRHLVLAAAVSRALPPRPRPATELFRRRRDARAPAAGP